MLICQFCWYSYPNHIHLLWDRQILIKSSSRGSATCCHWRLNPTRPQQWWLIYLSLMMENNICMCCYYRTKAVVLSLGPCWAVHAWIACGCNFYRPADGLWFTAPAAVIFQCSCGRLLFHFSSFYNSNRPWKRLSTSWKFHLKFSDSREWMVRCV